MKNKLDNIWLGLVVGLIIPVAFAYFFVMSTFGDMVHNENFWIFLTSKDMMIKMVCVALFPNMGLVFLLNSVGMWNACRGILISIVPYLLVIVFFYIRGCFV